MRRNIKLNSVIASSKKLIPKTEKIDSPSRLARKLGIDRAEKTRITLLQRTSSDSRTTYGRISEKILGTKTREPRRIINPREHPENEELGVSPWISRRFDVLRTDSNDDEITEDEKWMGHDELGRPIWEDVLDKHRKRLGWDSEEEYTAEDFQELPSIEYSFQPPGDWPPILPRNDTYTFRNYQVCQQNERAAHAINEILDRPAQRLNPLLITGKDGTGKTHLLWSTGWAFTRQDPEKVARLLSCSTIDSNFTLPENWSDRFVGTSTLLIDDIHMLFNKPEVMHSVGILVDWALNLGVQIVMTTENQSSGPSNRLSQIVRQAVKVELNEPSRESLILMLRSQSAGRNILLDDGMLAAITDRCGPGWGPTKAGLEEIILASESGDDIVDSNDVVRILSGSSPLKETVDSEEINLEDLGEEIANEILDTVFADPLNPAVEIHTVLPEIGSDEYTPPELMPSSSEDAIKSAVERHIVDDLVRIRENVDSALLPDERDAHLAASPDQLSIDERINVAMDLAPLSLGAEAAFQKLEDDLESHRSSIGNLESELYSIAAQIDHANPKELISLVDKLREVEEKLTEIDPDSLPLPEFEDAKIKRHAFKRLKRPEPVKERLEVLNPAPIMEVIRPLVTELKPTNVLVPVE